MIQRREIVDKYFNKTGDSIQYRYIDQYIVDDQIILGMYKYLYKVVNNKESPSAPSKMDRKIKDYLTKNYVFYK